MTPKELAAITETVEGYPVKNLVWRPVDNIITGLVQDPITGEPELRDGYVSGQWRKNGSATNQILNRTDLKLKINLVVSKI